MGHWDLELVVPRLWDIWTLTWEMLYTRDNDVSRIFIQNVYTLSLNICQNCDYFYRSAFPSHVKLYIQNDAVAALASGTMGKLHGCVLIAGTGSISYGFTEDGREARAAGAGPVLGDWGR